MIETKSERNRKPSNRTKIMLVGAFMWPWYQEACAKALESLGCEVIRFGWFDDFWRWVPDRSEPVYHSLYHQIQSRFQAGPIVNRVNRRLVRAATQEIPDIIWCYNVHLITPSTIQKLRKKLPDTTLCQYANDNPFSADSKPGLWRKYIDSIKYFDKHFSYRHQNMDDYYRYGAKDVSLLRAYFIPDEDYPVKKEEIPDKFKCDVVFAGHYEDDGRVDMLEAICEAGFDLRLYGGGWSAALPKLRNDSPLHALFPISPVTGIEYRYAINGAKVALCFLSTLNQDTYTRRNFQIPAMKTVMLSEHTNDLESLFQPDVEAMFFRDKADLLGKLRVLIENQDLRLTIAEDGYKRVYADGHDVRARMQLWLDRVL